MSELVQLSFEDRIARLVLNRSEKRNALSIDLLEALHNRVDELANRDDLAVCVVTGAEPTFCAGMDLKAVLNVPGAPSTLLGLIAELTIKLRRLPMVTIARVNGAAIGGGCGLMGVCDFAVTHPDAKIGYPEIDLGVCPAVVAPWLVRAIGSGQARRVLLEGGTMSGARAHEIGMVSHLVDREKLDERVNELSSRIARSGLEALVATKRLLNELDGHHLEEDVRRGAVLSAEIVQGAEARRNLARVYGGR